MASPTRDTTAGRVYNDLRNLARRTSRSTDEIMVEDVLERFLYRLATSPPRPRTLRPQGLLAHVARQVSPQRRVRLIEPVRELPRTCTGKILRHRLTTERLADLLRRTADAGRNAAEGLSGA
ncbi:hypothetical protein [Streptomyces sp. NBC_01429]|uniref:hypothetical protein n=1 Tax=Streptomyces sp. NBC_01429 TaxID=2903862 RepID=UPI002E2D3082|nr:hypothetical protein [Streptomyces sp. NBC_01429]